MSERVVVERVAGWWGLRRFVELPYRLYRHDPCWVPPLRSERRQFLTARCNPYFEHAEVALWLARRGRRVVGRVSSQIDHLHTSTHGERVVVFGHFECERDQEAARALLDAVACWGKERGATALRGPLSFSMHHESGLLIEGFDEPPVIGTPYNPPYYAELLEQTGLTKAMDLIGARAEVGVGFAGVGSLPVEMLQVADGVKKMTGVTVRQGSPEHLAAEVERVVAVYNQAWADNWGFVPLTPAETRALAHALEPVIVPALSIVAEVGDEPVGVLLGIRDLNSVLIRMRGRLLPFGWLRLLRDLRHVNACRLILFGVLEPYRGLGVGTLMVLEAIKAGLAAGFRQVEMSWMLETNQSVLLPLQRLGQRLGVRLHRRWRIYERSLQRD